MIFPFTKTIQFFFSGYIYIYEKYVSPCMEAPPLIFVIQHLLQGSVFSRTPRKPAGRPGLRQVVSHDGSMYVNGRLMLTKLGFLLMVNVTLSQLIYLSHRIHVWYPNANKTGVFVDGNYVTP